MLADAKEPEEVAERFHGYGGKVLQTTLPTEKAKKLEQLMAAR